MEQLTPGQSLTYEQAMSLPDGAVVSAQWFSETKRSFYTVGGADADGVPKKFAGASLDSPNLWEKQYWHDVRLESLPDRIEPYPIQDAYNKLVERQESGTISKDAYESLLPKRQASEIEKRAALALVESFSQDFGDTLSDPHARDLWRGLCAKYIEAYDYAKSIGAIE